MPTAAPAPTQATKRSQRSADEALIAGGVVGTASGVAFIQSALLYAKSNGILSDAHASEEDDSVVGVSTGNDDFFNRLARPAPSSFCPDKRMMAHFWRPFHKTQDQYNLLSREEFNRHLDLFYRAKPQQENHSRIIVHTVFATGVHESSKIGDHSSVHSAAAHYETASGLIQHVLPCKDVRTLQAILVVLHLSVLDPQRNSAGHLLGCASRVAASLGSHQEEISTSAEKVFPDFGRRMFWCSHRIDSAVADMSADPALLEDQDDASLTSHSTDSTLTEATPAKGSKWLSVQCSKVRDIQTDIANVMYWQSRPYEDDYVEKKQDQIELWLSSIPTANLPESISFWCQHAYHNLIMFLRRPSVVNSHPSVSDYEICFSSATSTLRLYEEMHRANAKVVDYSWMAVHWLFSAATTHLFCLWSNETSRASVAWADVTKDINLTNVSFRLMSEQWNAAQRIREIYVELARGTIKRFAGSKESADGSRASVVRDASDKVITQGWSKKPYQQGLLDYSMLVGADFLPGG